MLGIIGNPVPHTGNGTDPVFMDEETSRLLVEDDVDQHHPTGLCDV